MDAAVGDEAAPLALHPLAETLEDLELGAHRKLQIVVVDAGAQRGLRHRPHVRQRTRRDHDEVDAYQRIVERARIGSVDAARRASPGAELGPQLRSKSVGFGRGAPGDHHLGVAAFQQQRASMAPAVP